MLQVTISTILLGENPGENHTFDVISIGHTVDGECIITFVDRRRDKEIAEFLCVCTDSIFFKGLA